MNKLANALYAYQPKNDDELELKVGDKIEVIGYEEEGWWKGKSRGKIGVFPSNFVQVIDNNSQTATDVANSQKAPGKLSLFGAAKNSKTSLSSNSLNSNASGSLLTSAANPVNATSLNNSNNSNNSSTSNNLIMNNTQQEQQDSQPTTPGSYDATGEIRPRPIRGIGYGDIFAMGGIARLRDTSTDQPSDRPVASTISQKQIPKKPPPPTPVSQESNSSVGLPLNQAPALPPKPANQFSPLLQHSSSTKSLNQTQPPPLHSKSINQQVREQARVIYCYKPQNDDELELKLNDIINVIDRNIEDYGWWKGELNGKVGVFPDNFVELIKVQSDNQGSNQESLPNPVPLTPSTILSQQQQQQQQQQHQQQSTPTFPQNSESKLKSVFAATPKGFSRELESNLEKHSSLASFLSLKRTNKIQQLQDSPSLPEQSIVSNTQENGNKNEQESSQKLNHITANRAKGPSRRPPSNVLNKRNQFEEKQVKKEHNGREDDNGLSSLPTTGPPPTAIHDSLILLPAGQNARTRLREEPHDFSGLKSMVESMRTELQSMSELKSTVETMRNELKGMSELKSTVESIQEELRACQSATENQKRYIKELVTNLADERKKIAAMQVELDRNLK